MSDNKTIAFYIGSLSRGGAERVIINLAKFFKSQDYKVYLVTKTIDEPEYDVPDGIPRIIADITKEEETNSRVKNLVRRVMKLRKIWKDIKPNIIVSFIRKNNIMAIASSRGLKVPVVVCIRSNPARELQGRLVKPVSFLLFRKAAGIVVQTNQGREYMPDYLIEKTVVMPNSLTQDFLNIKHNNERNNEIVVVGRIDENKNQRMVLEAFDRIKEQYPNWKLHLYGDGSEAQKLKDIYACESVIFHGKVDNIQERIKDSSIFILPSKQEGMPNALIEAMVLGLACISTDCPCGGPADLIDNGVNGILIPVDDSSKLVEELSKLIEDKKLREALGTEAEKIADKLHPVRVNNMWLEYIEEVMIRKNEIKNTK